MGATILRTRTAERAGFALLVAFALLLAGAALGRWDAEVRDGAGYVTKSVDVAWGIAAALVLLALLEFTPLPRSLRGQIRWLSLAGIVLHSLGLLAGLYERFAGFDTALHVAFGFGASVLLVRSARLLLAPGSLLPRAALACLVLTAGLAIAAVWEVFEFLVGQVQGTRLQADLDDTMLDMIASAVGGTAAATWVTRRPARGRARLSGFGAPSSSPSPSSP